MTIRAALTGLTGGAVTLESGYLLDMTGMTFLKERPGYRRVAPVLLNSESEPYQGIAAPGVALSDLNAVLNGLDLWYPPHPGETRALIGGNVANNASGPRTFAFGSTRSYVTSLRVALMDGDLLNLQRGKGFAGARNFTLTTESGRKLAGTAPGYALPQVKSAAGLFSAPDMDLIDLFIGSEGILGCFLEIGLRFLPRREIHSEIFFLPETETALDLVDALRADKADASQYSEHWRENGLGILSLEFFDGNSLQLARQAGHRVPEGANAAIEVEWFSGDAPSEGMIRETAKQHGSLGGLAKAAADAFRYAVPRRVAELLKERSVPKIGTDFAVPEKSFREMFRFYEQMEMEFGLNSETLRTAKWGHIGDFHLHCNFLPEDSADVEKAKGLYLKLVREAVRAGGTLSAEHGVGKKTLADEQGVPHPFLRYMLGDEGLHEIADVKKIFDPLVLLNRGNMVPVSMLKSA